MADYSIMIMSRNLSEMLQECVDKICTNTPLDFEFVIVDDASDEDYTKLNYHGKVVTHVRMPKQSNCCNLRNVGMEMSKSKWVFWLDNDRFVGEGWYKTYLELVGDDTVGCIGQPKDARLMRKPFLPITQAEAMVEFQFAMDHNHANGEADFITSYCILVRKEAWRPTYCYGMPTPVLDPDLGANIKIQGYRVVVTSGNVNVFHKGSQTPRPGGLNYHHHLSRAFTKWWKFWEPHASTVFELYRGIPVEHSHNANEPGRNGTRGEHDTRDVDYEEIPSELQYHEI